MHVRVQANWNSVNPKRPDWLVKLDLALLEVESLRLQLVRDVGRGDRSDQLGFFADPRRDGETHLLHLRCEPGPRAATLLLGLLETLALLFDPPSIAGGRFVRESAREEI